MRDHEDNRPPEDIAHDIERTRAEVGSTIEAIQSKMTPGQLMDQAITYARSSLPADFGANLGNTVRDNPVPVALMGVGIAWLMMSGRNSDGRARMRRNAMADSDHDSSGSRVYYVGGGAHAGSVADYDQDWNSDTDSHTGGGSMQQAGDKAKDMKNKAGEKAEDLKNRASETGRGLMGKASELGNRISESASSMTGRAREMAQGASERMQSGGGSSNMKARAGALREQSEQQLNRARSNFSHMLDEQPLLLGVIGMAAGAVLAATLPGTRREDELMGRQRDDLLERAKQTGREQAETLKESAQRVAQTAKQEAEHVKDDVSAKAKGDGNGQAPQTSASISKDSPSSGTQSIH